MHSNEQSSQPPFGKLIISDVILRNVAEGRMKFLDDERKAVAEDPELRGRLSRIRQEVKNCRNLGR